MSLFGVGDTNNPEFIYTGIQMVPGGFVLSWAARGIGFGELSFFRERKKQRGQKQRRWLCATEYMGEEFAQKALAAWVASTMVVE